MTAPVSKKKKQLSLGKTSNGNGPKRFDKWIIIGLGVLVVAYLTWSHRYTNLPARTSVLEEASDERSGKELAATYCRTCHLYPAPSMLDRKCWNDWVLPEMRARLGLSPSIIEKHHEAEQLKALGVFPTNPVISMRQWRRIESYYLTNAPEQLTDNNPPNIAIGLSGFSMERPRFRDGLPTTSLTYIDPKHHEILVGDIERKALRVFDSALVLRQEIPLTNIPVSIAPVAGGIYVTCIGSLIPSDIPRGTLAFVPRVDDKYGTPNVILTNLPRPTQTSLADLNGDGAVDWVISTYGHNVGRFSWFENRGQDTPIEHILVPRRSGAIQNAVYDFNGDGLLDIMLLTSQQTESLEIFYNRGKGEFTRHLVFQKPPFWGHTHFELADFNGDGRQDLLVVNGATGEYFSLPKKPCHGLRILLNRMSGKFEEAFFFPMHGAYQAVVADFDQDGDLDIAAVSFYPDYQKLPQECFVYLENQGDLSFKASTFGESLAGRWMTVHAGDLDGDGDLDLVLGANYQGPGAMPKMLFDDWEKEGPAFVVLRNKLR